MNSVAGNASPPLFPVDMQIVKVPVPIAKIGQNASPLIHYQGILMALETKTIKLGIIRVIKPLYKKVFQILSHIRPMGFMTGGTKPVPNWAVLEFGTVYLFGFIFMTTEAKADLLRPLSEKPFEVRGMGCMTAGTLAFGYRLVGKLGSFYLGHLTMISFLAPVAVGTDGDLGGGQKEFIVLGTVRIMAIGALLLYWLMGLETILPWQTTQTPVATGA
jgi:hypothetical protein